MSQTVYTESELKIFRVKVHTENWEGTGFVDTERFEIRDGEEVLLSVNSLQDLLK